MFPVFFQDIKEINIANASEECKTKPRRKGSKQSSRLSLSVCEGNLQILDFLSYLCYNVSVNSHRGYTEKGSIMKISRITKLIVVLMVMSMLLSAFTSCEYLASLGGIVPAMWINLET